jgi:hypothetical protein
MPNAIKYSTTAQSLALKKGNFWVGTGDVGKGTTATTDYYNGVNPPSGGYTIYLNKASGGPQIYTAANDSQLIALTNIIAGANYTTRNQCLDYFMGQSDKIVTNMDYPAIVTDGLVMAFDSAYTLGYPLNGSTMYDMSTGNSFSDTDFGNPSWANNISAFTVCLLITKTATGTGYANHPINKWNSGYNVNASFILYHFENYLGNGQDGVLGWYGYGSASGWANIGAYGFAVMSVGQTFWVGFQFNNVNGGLAWANGAASGSRSGYVGNLGPTNYGASNMYMYLPSQIGTGYISHILYYNRELTDAEMVRNYNAVSSRVVI